MYKSWTAKRTVCKSYKEDVFIELIINIKITDILFFAKYFMAKNNKIQLKTFSVVVIK